MSRSLTAAVQTAAAAAEVRPAFFVFLNLDSGPIRVWSGCGDYTLGGNVFTGVGNLGEISPVEESTRVSARGIELSLSGISSSHVTIALSENYRGRSVTVWLAFFDAAGALIADEVQVFAGIIDTMTLNDNGDSSVLTLTAESRLIDLERPRETRYTDEEQQRLFPGDLGLQYVAGLQKKTLNWGGVVVPPPSGPGDAGGIVENLE